MMDLPFACLNLKYRAPVTARIWVQAFIIISQLIQAKSSRRESEDSFDRASKRFAEHYKIGEVGPTHVHRRRLPLFQLISRPVRRVL
jgi:hypothetical protein